MRILISFLFVMLAATAAKTQSAYELQCKNKAKEAAVEMYNNCVTESRNQEIDRIRAEYQSRLKELKNHYNGELKKLSPDDVSTPNDKNTTEPTSATLTKKNSKNSKTTLKATKSNKTIANMLPQKDEDRGPAIPLAPVQKQNIDGTFNSSKTSNNAFSDNDTIEVPSPETN